MRLTVAGLAGALALACARDKSPSVQTTSVRSDTVAAKRTVLIVGTSLTAGLGLDPDEAWPALLQAKIDSAGLPYHVVNAGLSGETSAGALRRIDWLLRGPVDVFVLETGANDGLRGLDPDTLRANIEAILAKVHAERPSAKLAVVQMEAPPNMGPDYTKKFRAIYSDAARDQGATLLPFLLDSVAGKPGLNQADGMHPNVAGAQIVARTEWRALAPLLR
jgi:acyl-CoA thioesterase I